VEIFWGRGPGKYYPTLTHEQVICSCKPGAGRA